MTKTKAQRVMDAMTSGAGDAAVWAAIQAPTASQIDERTDAIGRMLEEAGLSRGIPATATEPMEYGLGVEYRPETNELAIVSSHETFARFAFDAPIEAVESWIEQRAELSMVW